MNGKTIAERHLQNLNILVNPGSRLREFPNEEISSESAFLARVRKKQEDMTGWKL